MTDKMDVLPLSPARQCAMSYSRRLIGPFLDRDQRRNFGSVDKSGYDAHLLGHAFAGAAAAGRTIEVQRFDFFAYDGRLLCRLGARRHSQTNLKGILLRIERTAMRGCATYQIDTYIGKYGFHTLQDNFACQPRPRQGIPSRITYLALAHKTSNVTYADFERRRLSTRPSASNRDAIPRDLLQCYVAEVGGNVRCYIASW